MNISTTPKVQYAYSFVASSGGPNHSRLVSMTYPNGRVLNYNYNSGVDDRISRLSSLSDSSATIEAYSYLGLNTVVQRSHPQPGVNQTCIISGGNTDGGDQYTGLDRFGRVVEERWVNPNTSTITDDFLYTYDRDGNVLTRTNALDTSLNEQYSYDGFNRLVSFTQGSHTESWNLDAVGNWLSFTNNGSTQTSTFNGQNEFTSISGSGTPAYDNNANTLSNTANGTTYHFGYTYDAWNRLVKVQIVSVTTLGYSYDALGHRTQAGVLAVGNQLYYSSAWEVLEEDKSGTGAMQDQYVWSAVYVDALVERDTTSARLYVQQDANWNVTAVITSTGTVEERYAYDPYGMPTFYNSTWTTTYSSSQTGQLYLFQGGRYENYSSYPGLYNFRHRDESPTLGRWLEQDPIAYGADDSNLYDYVTNDPGVARDPFGTFPTLFPLRGNGLKMTVKVPAKATGMCGGAIFEVSLAVTDIFGQPDNALNGWVIQHVIAVSRASACDPNHSILETDNLYEAWQVVSGKVYDGFGRNRLSAHHHP